MIEHPQALEAEELANNILTLSRDTLLLHLRFLEPAICRIEFAPDPETTIATDGSFFYFSFLHVIKTYRLEKELVTRDYLHTLLHCIFHHPFIGDRVDSLCWDLACDIAVEKAIDDLQLPYVSTLKESRQNPVLAAFAGQVPAYTAEHIYHYLQECNLEAAQLLTLREPFLADDHEFWYRLTKSNEPEKNSGDDDSDNGNTNNSSSGQEDLSTKDREDDSQSEDNRGSSSDENEPNQKKPDGKEGERKKEWEEVSAQIQTDLETLSRKWADKAGSLLRNLRECNRERYDYTEFLKKFAVYDEILQASEDEFDYIYYTYGLKLYKNMPLIEPLEYKEAKKIKEFAIVIDTSASVDGELVETFIRKTYNILKQTESFFTKINLHIIQCDTQVQEDTKITCEEEMEEYLNHMTLKGFGGTDFRPAFSYVEELIAKKEFLNLKGLLYFTDGEGSYPTSQPAYETAFVFIDDAYEDKEVPVWAMKLILTKEEVKQP